MDGFRMFGFEGLHGNGGGFGTTPVSRVGQLAPGSVLLLAEGARYTGLTDGSTGFFDNRRRTAQLIDPVEVVGTPDAVSLRTGVAVLLTDLDTHVPQGTQVIVEAGTLATVLHSADGSTGVVAPVVVQPGGGEPILTPENAWWMQQQSQQSDSGSSWLKWGLVAVGLGAAGWTIWSLSSRKAV
jgi:hypothetical protein